MHAKPGTVSRSKNSYQPGPVALSNDTIVGGKWKVVKKLGAGGCGAVYVVEAVGNPKQKAALKAESNFVAGGSVLKIEVEILKRLKGRDHIANLLGSGKLEKYQYMVMTLLGECLCNLLRKKSRCSISTQTRIGIQVLHGLKIVHDIGFVHRDIKPANLALGRQGKGKHLVHILDFGLSREYVLNQGKTVMRRPRSRALFRGTTRYASVATHDRIEQGRCDDLWSLIYVMAECRNRLPWSNIITLTYYLRPDYVKLYTLLEEIMKEGEYKFSDPWDWDKSEKTPKTVEETQHTDDGEKEWAINPEVFAANPFGF
uniref:Protein kinase domain-containing protein n=1 Tax=Pristionchus pacificus TaxID=54126 RepID=A0A2A6BP39_PRIPA|eukprot:PDM67677.1 protein kinase [Pristionchus pacificus]